MPKWPFRMVVTGSTGCGKTHLTMNMIATMLEVDRLVVIAKNVLEDNYEKLKLWCEMKEAARDETISLVEENNDKLMIDGADQDDLTSIPVKFTYSFSSNLEDMPTMAGMENTDWRNTQTLVIIDDMITEKDQSIIKDFIPMYVLRHRF